MKPIFPMKRTPLKAKTPMRKVSAKRKAHKASADGKAGLEYMRRVKQLPCVICGKPGPSDAHHVFHDRYGTRKASDFDTIPLCKSHHQDGPQAIHNGKQSWRDRWGPDHSYIAQTRAALDCDTPPHPQQGAAGVSRASMIGDKSAMKFTYSGMLPIDKRIGQMTEPHIAASVFKTLKQLQKDAPDLVLVREGYLTLVETCRDMEAELETLRAGAGKYDGMRGK